jgi:hypothetical protein
MKESYEEQKKRLTEEFRSRGIIDTEDTEEADEVEIVDELEYVKEPKNHQPFFRDPLKDFDDSIFDLDFERPISIRGRI